MAENNPIASLVSIVVPCYNCGKYLAETLDSVLAQEYINWECIILDDGSTDDSKVVAARYTEKDKRFRYVYQSNKGLPAARNAAIKESKGKFILPLDADDKISPKYLSKAVPVLEKDNNVKLVYCKAELFDKAAGLWEIREYSYKKLLKENVIFCSALYRKEDFEKAKGYDEKLTLGFEDWEFWIRLLSENDKVVQLPEVLFYYRIKESSMRMELDIERQRKIRQYVYQEHRELYDRYFTLPEVIFENYREGILADHKLKQATASYDAVVSSKDYRLGKLILSPVRFFLNLFK